MKNLISKYSIYVVKNPLIILFLILLAILTASQGILNFKLDASSDALVLEGDESLKTYRENEKEFGDSSFLIVTFKPEYELFSDKSLEQLSEIEKAISKLDGVESVLSLLDAPIFFQPKVGLTDVANNLKDLTTEGINLIKAKKEIINLGSWPFRTVLRPLPSSAHRHQSKYTDLEQSLTILFCRCFNSVV